MHHLSVHLHLHLVLLLVPVVVILLLDHGPLLLQLDAVQGGTLPLAVPLRLYIRGGPTGFLLMVIRVMLMLVKFLAKYRQI